MYSFVCLAGIFLRRQLHAVSFHCVVLVLTSLAFLSAMLQHRKAQFQWQKKFLFSQKNKCVRFTMVVVRLHGTTLFTVGWTIKAYHQELVCTTSLLSSIPENTL